MRRGRGRVHVGQLNGRRGRRGVWHRGPVVPGIAAVPVVRTRVGLVSASTPGAAASASTAAAAATATAAGRRRVYVRAAVRPVGGVRRRGAGPVAAAAG